MTLFRGKYDLNKDIANTQEQLRRIERLHELKHHPAWIDVEKVFTGIISSLTQEMFSLCSDPKGNDIEIRCKRMVAEALGSILSTITGIVESETQTRQNLENKVRSMQNLNQPVI